MEDGDFSVIPGGEVYIQGFLRNYADNVGIESNDIIKQYKKISKPKKEKDSLKSIHQKTPRTDTLLSNLTNFIRWNSKKICSVFFTVVFFIIFIKSIGVIKEKKRLQDAPPIPEQIPIENKGPENGINSDHPIEKTIPETEVKEVMIEIIEDTVHNTVYLIDADFINVSINNITSRCWVLVYQDGNQVFEGILNAGEKKSWKAENDVNIRIGNPVAVNLTVNDKDLGSLTGEARNFIFKKRI